MKCQTTEHSTTRRRTKRFRAIEDVAGIFWIDGHGIARTGALDRPRCTEETLVEIEGATGGRLVGQIPDVYTKRSERRDDAQPETGSRAHIADLERTVSAFPDASHVDKRRPLHLLGKEPKAGAIFKVGDE